MNNKIIAVGVVVALCAVALIGVGYAYTATMTNTNTIDSQYVVLDVGATGKASAFFDGSNADIEFNTVTDSEKITWTPVGTTVVNNATDMELNIVGNNAAGNIGLTLTTLGSNAFTTALLSEATITFSCSGQDSVEYTSTDGSNWTCTDNKTFAVDNNYTVSVTIIVSYLTIYNNLG